MRFLHTSDWHLGQKFIGQNRDAEYAAALDWLLQTIENEQVDALIVAGDVFDINNPPVSAEELYYRFLTRLIGSRCRHIVIVGGNHDLPSRLNAPAGLLRALNVHVVGSATDDPADEIVELREADGSLAAVVAAVPFLRDKDLKISVSGESTDERVNRIREGIAEHYRQIGELVSNQMPSTVHRPPSIVTGHLHAAGAVSHSEQRNIYIGNLDNIAADQFPEVFDYVALGHIHRPQRVGKFDHIRYSGSLIPLSFSETQDRKIVLLLDFLPTQRRPEIREIAVPIFRKLLSVRGSLPDVEAKLEAAHNPDAPLPAWVEVVVESDHHIPNLDLVLREKAKNWRLEILKIKNERRFQTLDDLAAAAENLDNLSPEEVFLKKIEGLPEIEQAELVDSFRELQDWAREQSDER